MAEQAGTLQGFALFSVVLDEATVLNIAVHPDLRRQGLGRHLLQVAMGCMREAGAQRCLLEVRESNSSARRLYENTGFQADGVRRNYYPDGPGREDAVLLSRRL